MFGGVEFIKEVEEWITKQIKLIVF
jgi:hypothetical protein